MTPNEIRRRADLAGETGRLASIEWKLLLALADVVEATDTDHSVKYDLDADFHKALARVEALKP